jgi:hypothetical protein
VYRERGRERERARARAREKMVRECGNVYPYTVTDDRSGRDKKRKDNGEEFSRDCIVLGNLIIIRFFLPIVFIGDS